MTSELLALGLTLLCALLPWLAGWSSSRVAKRVVVGCWVACFPLLVAMAFRHRNPVHVPAPPTDRPVELRTGGYVSSETCAVCHPRQHATWHASFHRTMTQLASPDSVKAPFEGVSLSLDGSSYDLIRRGDEYRVEMDEPFSAAPPGKAPRVERRIVMTTGSHHMQVYWFESGRGRTIGQLPFVYLIGQQRWVPSRSSFLHPPSNEHDLDFGRWNAFCIGCHSTHPEPRIYRETTDSRVSEFGISCEACHGPAEEHVRANRNPIRRYGYHVSDAPDPTIVNPARLSSHRASQVCGVCHGVLSTYSREAEMDFIQRGYRFRPGDDLARTWFVVGVEENEDEPMMELFEGKMQDFFWPDGMVRVTGREYNGLYQTACFRKGEMSCLSCHTMHTTEQDPRPRDRWTNDQLKPDMLGNRACVTCHVELQAEDRLTTHTRHAYDSSGSRCYDCHMPHTTYGLLGAVRTHQIDSPDASLTLKTGRPNACNQCHLDRSLGWTAAYLEQWYGLPRPELTRDESAVAASVLWALSGDANQRALAAWTLGWRPAQEVSSSDWIAPVLAPLLADPYDAVRYIASRSLRTLRGFESFEYDYLASPAERISARQEALSIWSALHGLGIVSQETVDRLLMQRDDRPVFLSE